MTMDLGIKDRVAMVTGAGRNIGREISLRLAQEGVHLVLSTRKSVERLEETADLARAAGVHVITDTCDVSDGDQVSALARRAEDELGGVDILVNNAVERLHGDLLDTTLDGWNQCLAVNLTGPFHCAQAVLPSMIAKGWGRIISFSGIRAYTGGGGVPKATVKLGIVGFTRAVAWEFGKHGITANCIAPGSIEGERDAGFGHRLTPNLPIDRFGTSSEIAATVLYLASEPAAYITGQCVAVNGGAHFS